jgi:hypothetical protein
MAKNLGKQKTLRGERFFAQAQVLLIDRISLSFGPGASRGPRPEQHGDGHNMPEAADERL